MNVLTIFEDSDPEVELSVVDNILQKCHWMQVECKVGYHPHLVNAFLFATSIASDGNNHFKAKFVFSEIAHLLHDTTEEDVSDWYDKYVDTGADFIGNIMDQVHEDIDSNVFSILADFKTALEDVCQLDIHHLKDKIFEIAKFSTFDKVPDVRSIDFLHELANNYLNLACVFVPNKDLLT